MIFKEYNKTFRLDTENNRIDFLDNRFYRTESGSFVPSVTTILDAYPKSAAFYDWLKKHGENLDDIRDEAGRRGSTVHELTELYDQGLEVSLMDANGFIGYKLMEWAMFERYVEFRSLHQFTIIQSEMNIVSNKLGYAGTLDRLIEMNGENVLIDIKTSGSIWPSYWLQLAAYEKLLTESMGYNPCDKKAILWLNAKTKTYGKNGAIQGPGWQLIFREENDTDLKLFEATHQLWLAENGGMKPKQMKYKLSHKINS
jgi:hypothetical protein